MIISNPPYIASAVVDGLDTSVRDYEPRLALDGGPDGLVAYRSIISLASERAKPGTWLIFEIGFDQRESVTALLETAGFGDIAHAKDLAGRDRVIAARK